ncbi:MAG: hypothetical protein ACJA06_002285 [Halocynthiibacter sp.]|jgi:uncharacterized protein
MECFVMVRRFVRLLSVVFALLVLMPSANAQTLPDFNDPMINDWAQRYSDNDARNFAHKINRIRAKTGAEIGIVTLQNSADYGWETREALISALFGKWADTDARRTRGILVFVDFIGDDPEAQIALGTSYSAAAADTREGHRRLALGPTVRRRAP